MSYIIFLPTISSIELIRRSTKIKTVINSKDGKFFLSNLGLNDLKCLFLNPEDKDVHAHLITRFDPENYTVIEDVICFYHYSLYYHFNPSIEEVLSQIPEDLIPLCDAFEIIQDQLDISTLWIKEILKIAKKNNLHVSIVRLYSKKCHSKVA